MVIGVIPMSPAVKAPDRYEVMRFGPEGNLYVFDHQHCSFIEDDNGKIRVWKKNDYEEPIQLARSLESKHREEKARKRAEEAERLAKLQKGVR